MEVIFPNSNIFLISGVKGELRLQGKKKARSKIRAFNNSQKELFHKNEFFGIGEFTGFYFVEVNTTRKI